MWIHIIVLKLFLWNWQEFYHDLQNSIYHIMNIADMFFCKSVILEANKKSLQYWLNCIYSMYTFLKDINTTAIFQFHL